MLLMLSYHNQSAMLNISYYLDNDDDSYHNKIIVVDVNLN